jgi:hypothetical protein
LLAVEALFEGKESTVYNLGNSRGYSVLEVIRTASKVTGHRIPAVAAEAKISLFIPGIFFIERSQHQFIHKTLGQDPHAALKSSQK